MSIEPDRDLHLEWNGTEWVDDRCGCRYHPDDDNGSHGGAPHVHRCEKHREAVSEPGPTSNERVRKLLENIAGPGGSVRDRAWAREALALLREAVPEPGPDVSAACARLERAHALSVGAGGEMAARILTIAVTETLALFREPAPTSDASLPGEDESGFQEWRPHVLREQLRLQSARADRLQRVSLSWSMNENTADGARILNGAALRNMRDERDRLRAALETISDGREPYTAAIVAREALAPPAARELTPEERADAAREGEAWVKHIGEKWRRGQAPPAARENRDPMLVRTGEDGPLMMEPAEREQPTPETCPCLHHDEHGDCTSCGEYNPTLDKMPDPPSTAVVDEETP